METRLCCMSLLMAAYVALLNQCRLAENQCNCNWCNHQRKLCTDGIAPPRHVRMVMKSDFCPKAESHEGSGFQTANAPVHSLGCCVRRMREDHKKWVEKEIHPPHCTECAHALANLTSLHAWQSKAKVTKFSTVAMWTRTRFGVTVRV